MRATILIADDDAPVRTLTARALSRLSVTVLTAEDGLEARDIATRYQPDVVIADWCMPGIDGLFLLQSLKERNHRLLSVLVTGYPTAGLSRAAAYAQISAVLFKPIDPISITTCVARLMKPVQASGCTPDARHHEKRRTKPRGEEVGSPFDPMTEGHRRLVNRIASAFPELGWDRASDAVTDAVLSFLPQRPTSARSIYARAWRLSRDWIASDRARRRREVDWHNLHWNSAVPPFQHEQYRRAHALWLAVLRSLPDEDMRSVFSLWAAGERRTAAYAHHLSLDHLPPIDQERSVKRAKDRMTKFLRRSVAVKRAIDEVLGLHPPTRGISDVGIQSGS